MRKKAYAIHQPTEVILDVDTTMLPTYGKQVGGEYIHHYQVVGYHPTLCYDGNTGDLLKAELREGNIYCSTEADKFIDHLLSEYIKEYPEMKLLVHGGSGFVMPDLYKTVENYPTARYIIRLKDNAVLQENVQEAVKKYMDDSVGKENVLPHYGEFFYAAKSW